MKSSVLTKAALCICPPVAVATTVAHVPPVRHAVHHLTEPARPRPAAHPAPPCVPVAHRTLASELPSALTPDDVLAYTAITPTPTANPIGPGPLAPPALPSGPGTLPNQPGGTGAVPEPAAWMTMVVGFGLIGAGVRGRRRYLLRSSRLALAGGGEAAAARGLSAILGGGAVSGAATLAAGGPVGATARLAQVGGKMLHSPLLAKAALCVCPPVAMVASTAALPPVRHAVYNATAPKTPIVRAPVVASGPQPCVPVDVPTAAEAVQQGGDTLAVFKPTPAWPG